MVLNNTAAAWHPRNVLATQRVYSIDALRGITILVMIFVNEVAGVTNIPSWLKHAGAADDTITFPDIVFPAFLFIVGMSIPFAIASRISHGSTFWQLLGHIAFRTIGLIVLGVFMVNAEGNYHQPSMEIPIYLWSLFFFVCVILVWNVYTFKKKELAWILRGIGIGGLLALAFMYRGGPDGSQGLTPQWWGILGLIGWAYFISSMVYLVTKGNITGIMLAFVVCIVFFSIGNAFPHDSIFSWFNDQKGHATHTSIVLSGIIVSLFVFDESIHRTRSFRLGAVGAFALLCAAIAFVLRPYHTLSKIYATPSWALYCVAICAVVFLALYWWIDVAMKRSWVGFFKPAASNPLLTYIIPYIIGSLLVLLSVRLPEALRSGLAGVLWAAAYAVSIMLFVRGLNYLRIRLQL